MLGHTAQFIRTHADNAYFQLARAYNTSSCVREIKKSTDHRLMLEEAVKHQSVTLASEMNWLRLWKAARDKGPYWTNIAQSFYRLFTRLLFGDIVCNKCNSIIEEDISYFIHLTQIHTPSTADIPNLLADLCSQDSEPVTISFHV